VLAICRTLCRSYLAFKQALRRRSAALALYVRALLRGANDVPCEHVDAPLLRGHACCKPTTPLYNKSNENETVL